MSYCIGIDVGGTGSRWAVIAASGALVARGSAPGATGHLFNPEMREKFTAMAHEIAAQAGGTIKAAHAGVTGLGGRAIADARDILASALGCAPDRVSATDDMELAFRARFAPGEGHLVSAGTGSVGLHIASDGTPIRVGGRGTLIDDGGSGAWIVLRALDCIYRQLDETGRTGLLGDTLFAAIGGSDWDTVRAYVYAGDRGRIGALAPAVAAAARDGDADARALLERAIAELARLARALVARGGPLPIGFVGGVLTLDPSIKPGLAAALPGHAVDFPTIDAALAAAAIANAQYGSPR